MSAYRFRFEAANERHATSVAPARAKLPTNIQPVHPFQTAIHPENRGFVANLAFAMLAGVWPAASITRAVYGGQRSAPPRLSCRSHWLPYCRRQVWRKARRSRSRPVGRSNMTPESVGIRTPGFRRCALLPLTPASRSAMAICFALQGTSTTGHTTGTARRSSKTDWPIFSAMAFFPTIQTLARPHSSMITIAIA